MTTPATNSIVNKQEQYFTVKANGTSYRITVILFNNKGEARALGQNSFQALTFETSYTTPFLLGSLTVVNESSMDLLNINGSSVTNTYGHGEEFIKIKITYLSKTRKTITLLDKLFITKNKMNTVQQNQKQVVYYFVDIVYSHLQNKRLEWCTDMVNTRGKQQYGKNTVNAGRALKHLLKHFTTDDSIIDESDWDDGIGKLYYTLPPRPALHAINEILNSYVSSDNSAGILTYYNGKFQLKSLKRHINTVFKKDNSSIQIGRHVTGAFKIQTLDRQREYSNKQPVNLFGKSFEYIPVDLNSIDFTDIQPDVTLNRLIKNEVIQFSTDQKKFTIHSDQGTLKQVSHNTNVQSLPGGDDTILNIDENKKFNIKKRIFKLSDEKSTTHHGTINLQKQLLNALTSASFSTGGNIDFSANKFLYMTIDLSLKNKFAHKIPGFWYIKNNLTTITSQQFSSIIECVKLDKPK